MDLQALLFTSLTECQYTQFDPKTEDNYYNAASYQPGIVRVACCVISGIVTWLRIIQVNGQLLLGKMRRQKAITR